MNEKLTTRSIQISANLKLVSNTLQAAGSLQPQPAQPTNRIAIFDRSGSMGWTINKLVDDLYDWAARVKQGDTITLGWFSGPGQYRFAIKGLRVGGQQDLDVLRKVLDACRSTINTTCFSQILGELPTVIDDLKPVSERFALTFFTDGCPVVPDVRREVAAVERNLGLVRGSIGASLWVGYGDYYNRQLMANMAQWSGGALIHADNLDRFRTELTTFTAQTTDSRPMVEIGVPAGQRIAVFSLSGKNPVIHPQDAKSIRLPEAQEATVYALVAGADGGRSDLDEITVRGLYAGAAVLSQLCKTDMALDLIGLLGDVGLAKRLVNSYTVSELGSAEGLLTEAAADAACRYREGQVANCVPDRNAFCVLDALGVLVDDDDAKFWPSDERFDYRRIGTKALVTEGYSKFTADAAPCPMNTLVMHESRPNLSVSVQIPGKIVLNEQCAQFGLLPDFSTFQYRTFTVVRDGALNVSCLPCSMSKESFERLRKEGVIDDAQWSENGVYGVRLDRLPVMNRGMADGCRSAKALCGDLLEMYRMEARLKALRFYLKQLDPEGKAQKPETMLPPATVEYLETQGVKRNGYQPPVTKADATDTYMAKEFKIAAKGLSSLPKIDDVVAKRKDGKKQTTSGALVLEGIEEYEQLAKQYDGKPQSKLIKALQELIGSKTRQMRGVRARVQRAKFAVLLGNAWFDEFDSRDGCKLQVGDYEFSLGVNEVEVEL